MVDVLTLLDERLCPTRHRHPRTGQTEPVRTYAVRLDGDNDPEDYGDAFDPANYGPEFNSQVEASRWGFENVNPKGVHVAYIRDGRKVGESVWLRSRGMPAESPVTAGDP
jgi:hypothetical protein